MKSELSDSLEALHKAESKAELRYAVNAIVNALVPLYEEVDALSREVEELNRQRNDGKE